MRAVTQLKVLDEMEVTISLSMTVREVRAIRKALDDKVEWPCRELKNILDSSIKSALAAYESERECP